MKPDYYVHAHMRTFMATTPDGDQYAHVKVTRKRGEHVLSYRIWKTMKPRDVARIIGPLAKDVK